MKTIKTYLALVLSLAVVSVSVSSCSLSDEENIAYAEEAQQTETSDAGSEQTEAEDISGSEDAEPADSDEGDEETDESVNYIIRVDYGEEYEVTDAETIRKIDGWIDSALDSDNAQLIEDYEERSGANLVVFVGDVSYSIDPFASDEEAAEYDYNICIDDVHYLVPVDSVFEIMDIICEATGVDIYQLYDWL